MGFKFKHYAAKTLDPNYRFQYEAIILETAIGIVSAVFAIGGYQAGLITLFLPCTVLALLCFLLVISNCALYLCSFIKKRKN